MAEQSTLLRQWSMLRVLGARHLGVTVRLLADEVEVCDKTIRRDLATLQTAGFPIEETRGDFGRKSYHLDLRRGAPNLAFTLDESLALYLGRRALLPLAGTAIWEAAQRAFDKIRSSWGEEVLKYLDRMSGAFQETAFGWTDYARHAATLETLLAGIEQRRVVFVTYRSQNSTESVTYPIHPYRLTRHQGSLYAIGYKPDDAQVKTWRVDRIETARLDPMPFVVPAGLDLDAHFAGSFGIFDGDQQLHVRVRIHPPLARYVQEKHWHASQQFTPQPDGSVIVEFDLSGTVELTAWLLSFGRHAEVIEPASLRDQIVAELQGTLAAYGEASTAPPPQDEPRKPRTTRKLARKG